MFLGSVIKSVLLLLWTFNQPSFAQEEHTVNVQPNLIVSVEQSVSKNSPTSNKYSRIMKGESFSRVLNTSPSPIPAPIRAPATGSNPTLAPPSISLRPSTSAYRSLSKGKVNLPSKPCDFTSAFFHRLADPIDGKGIIIELKFNDTENCKNVDLKDKIDLRFTIPQTSSTSRHLQRRRLIGEHCKSNGNAAVTLCQHAIPGVDCCDLPEGEVPKPTQPICICTGPDSSCAIIEQYGKGSCEPPPRHGPSRKLQTYPNNTDFDYTGGEVKRKLYREHYQAFPDEQWNSVLKNVALADIENIGDWIPGYETSLVISEIYMQSGKSNSTTIDNRTLFFVELFAVNEEDRGASYSEELRIARFSHGDYDPEWDFSIPLRYIPNDGFIVLCNEAAKDYWPEKCTSVAPDNLVPDGNTLGFAIINGVRKDKYTVTDLVGFRDTEDDDPPNYFGKSTVRIERERDFLTPSDNFAFDNNNFWIRYMNVNVSDANPGIWLLEPSTAPSALPSLDPSAKPSTSPSVMPSLAPSSVPSREPSSKPSETPSLFPSVSPSEFPSSKPSLVPTTLPSLFPSVSPSAKPSISSDCLTDEIIGKKYYVMIFFHMCLEIDMSAQGGTANIIDVPFSNPDCTADGTKGKLRKPISDLEYPLPVDGREAIFNGRNYAFGFDGIVQFVEDEYQIGLETKSIEVDSLARTFDLQIALPTCNAPSGAPSAAPSLEPSMIPTLVPTSQPSPYGCFASEVTGKSYYFRVLDHLCIELNMNTVGGALNLVDVDFSNPVCNSAACTSANKKSISNLLDTSSGKEARFEGAWNGTVLFKEHEYQVGVGPKILLLDPVSREFNLELMLPSCDAPSMAPSKEPSKEPSKLPSTKEPTM